MFKDVPEQRWSYDLIKRMVRAGIYQGYPDATFRPEQAVTREQDAAVADRIVKGLPGITLSAEMMPSIVVIHHGGYGLGSGVWVAPWKVLTNAHVVETLAGDQGALGVFGYEGDGISAEDGHGFDPGGAMPATRIAVSHEYDLALLDVEMPAYGHAITIKVPDFGPGVMRGEKVWALGTPFGLPWDYSDGVIRHPMRRVNYWNQPQVLYGLTVPINPGNSGGGLFNNAGEFVGVPSAGATGVNSFTFAVPVYQCRQFLEGLL